VFARLVAGFGAEPHKTNKTHKNPPPTAVQQSAGVEFHITVYSLFLCKQKAQRKKLKRSSLRLKRNAVRRFRRLRTATRALPLDPANF